MTSPEPAAELFPAADEAPALHRLRTRLAADADAAGLLDLAYRTVDSPVGSLLLVATERGLVRVAFAGEDHDAVLAALATRISPRVLHAPARLDQPARELAEYFAGQRQTFTVPVDLRLSSGFRRQVLDRMREIAYGRTASYRGLAVAAGSPRAVRAVGSACATNPLPVVIPCHRVLRSDGTLGGYLGGLAAKTVLLELESAGTAA
ncbi:methylated-DNA--[protein]-cysteine S-methyltransferase [Rhodococcus sp. X156]|uniref:methylated-DNA--[protein]-cysteine S-methyltransferase n=1 Tax=Rhodococcus sp. X156 TaxID=2499145 RepID=UPI000FDB3EB3|nr:methylated-DNA--[protein]-cysteine S-methyltransferase [Rhodococcus sp. X156]